MSGAEVLDACVAPTIDKREATARARAALAGVTMARIENDAGRMVYIVSRWAMTRELEDLDAVEAWLDRVAGSAA